MHDISKLVERLEKVERQNRRMKRIGIAGVLCAGAVVLVGAQGNKPEVLEEMLAFENDCLPSTSRTLKSRRMSVACPIRRSIPGAVPSALNPVNRIVVGEMMVAVPDTPYLPLKVAR